RRDFSLCREACRLQLSRSPGAFRLCGRHAALIATRDRKCDHRPGRPVMEDISHAFEIAGRTEPLLRKPRVHSHVHTEYTDVRTSLTLGAVDLRLGDPDARLRFEYIRACRDRPLAVEACGWRRGTASQATER